MRQFAILSKEQLDFIENIEIDDVFITMDVIYKVRENLNLYDKSVDELRAIRNAVVKHLGQSFENVEHDFRAGKKILTNMSGITCVIDDIIFNKGCEV